MGAESGSEYHWRNKTTETLTLASLALDQRDEGCAEQVLCFSIRPGADPGFDLWVTPIGESDGGAISAVPTSTYRKRTKRLLHTENHSKNGFFCQ